MPTLGRTAAGRYCTSVSLTDTSGEVGERWVLRGYDFGEGCLSVLSRRWLYRVGRCSSGSNGLSGPDEWRDGDGPNRSALERARRHRWACSAEESRRSSTRTGLL